MKKHLHNSLRALFLSLAVLLSMPMLAVEVEIDGIRYDLVAETKQATVLKKSSGGYSGEVVIPESVEHESTAYSVTSIGDQAFYCCFGLTSVTIPNSVKSIGNGAFQNCSGLTSVHISDIIAWCNIEFGDSYSNPLYNAHHLYLNGAEVKDLVIPNSVTCIKNYAFYGCSGLTSVTIGNSVKSIGRWAFSNCSDLTSVTIANGVESIGDGAFSECYDLTSVTIPNSVTSIVRHTFSSCSGLTSVSIPNSVTSIGDYAFSGCKGLTSVTIPNSVKSIEEGAFAGCFGLTSVTIGNGVESIGYLTFLYCSGLTDVYCYAENVPSTKSDAFEDSPIQNATLHVPAGSVDSYKTAPWNGFENIVAITTEVDGINYDFNADTKQAAVIAKSSDEYSGEIVIPESVEYGGTTYSVTSIGSSAFRNCSGLTSVTIPNSVTSIGDDAFSCCSGLTSVTIGNSVTNIGDYAFYACSKLLDVYCYAENVPSIGSYVFFRTSVQSGTLHVPAGSIDSYRANSGWDLFRTITPILNIALSDGADFENDVEQSVTTLTYTRTLPNMLWNPLYVPFKIPYEALEENYEVAYINAMHSYDNDDNGEIDEMVMEIVKIKAGTLKPNHPYLIKAKNDEAMEMSIVQENATLYPAEITTLVCSSVYTKFEITGTYQEMTSEDLNGSLVISTDGAWKLLSSTSILKPFRFYLTISNLEGSPVEIAEEAMSSVRIRVMGESDNATGIDETENTENSVVFDLSGRRVSTPAKGGVYIINGKKVIY